MAPSPPATYPQVRANFEDEDASGRLSCGTLRIKGLRFEFETNCLPVLSGTGLTPRARRRLRPSPCSVRLARRAAQSSSLVLANGRFPALPSVYRCCLTSRWRRMSRPPPFLLDQGHHLPVVGGVGSAVTGPDPPGRSLGIPQTRRSLYPSPASVRGSRGSPGCDGGRGRAPEARGPAPAHRQSIRRCR